MNNPLIPMVSVAGSPSREQIGKYLSGLQENHIQQVLIYPRSGCQIPYLSDRWFTLIEDFIFHAKQLDMRIWLYDDFNWPSGDAAGAVTAFPEFHLRSLRITGPEQGKIVSATEGDHLYFGEKAFTDLMSEKAVEYFIQCTHQQYYERFAPEFGQTIVGIFTDEPAVGYACGKDSIPYYDELPEDYLRQTGRDLYEDIRQGHPDLTVDAMALIGKRFRSNYIDRLSRWCEERGILMTGHLMNDSSPMGSVRANGDLLKCLCGFMLPGIDEIDSDLTNRALYPLLGAAQYAAGEHGAMAELFALGPCDLPYSTKLRMIFLAACFKIDHYFLAISHMDFIGNTSITDFFQHFGVEQPDFPGIGELGRQAALAAQYAKKDFRADVYVRYPTRVCAAQLLSGSKDTPLAMLLEELVRLQIQWKFLTDGDKPGKTPVIEFEPDFRYRLNDTVSDDPAVIAAQLKSKPLVKKKDGQLPEGIFVRRYTDGDYILVNLSDTTGAYLVNGKSMELGHYAVLTKQTPLDPLPRTESPTPITSFRLFFDRANVTRVVCNEKGEGAISCEARHPAVFAIRKDMCVSLNDNPLYGGGVAILPPAFAHLYSTAKPLMLRQGITRIQLEQDYCYLPTTLLIGDFETRHDGNTLILEKHTELKLGERVERYGVAWLERDVFIPRSAKTLRLYGTKLYVQVYANNILVGEALAPPYEFDLRKFQAQRVRLIIRIHSTIGPMFGNTDLFPREGNFFKKRLTDPELLVGLDGITFLS